MSFNILLMIALNIISNATCAPKSSIEKRQTNLSFEDGVIENMSRPSLESLDMSGDKLTGPEAILFLKRQNFRAEIQQSILDLRYLP